MEVGVFRGEFAHSIYTLGNPDTLLLVDTWDGIVCSGDQNGNNFCHYSGKDLESFVRDSFSNKPNVQIQKTYSSIALESLPENSLDVIYIDADHSYEGCKRDLDLAYRKVKSGGWICGHDYLTNTNKATNVYVFGVHRAVNEFCKENNVKIHALAMDGLVSYAIKNTK